MGKLLFFFKYAIDDGDASFYALLEVMKSHGAAKHGDFIPTVTPFSSSENKKVVVIDVADIVSVVGLLKTKTQGNSYFVIAPSTTFEADMKTTAGAISNLC